MGGKLVLITGVTRGLGRAMAEEFIRLGHTVLGCGRSEGDINQLRLRYKQPHDFCPGISAPEFSFVIDVNVKGVANVIRHFVPAMIKRRKGVIVNFSSGWGRSTDAEVAPYCASKWAIEGLTLALAQELPGDLAAVSFNPGVINTEMLQSCFGGSASAYPSATDWAKTAVSFLLKLGLADNGKQLTAP